MALRRLYHFTYDSRSRLLIVLYWLETKINVSKTRGGDLLYKKSTVPGQYPTTYTTFNPIYFFLEASFKRTVSPRSETDKSGITNENIYFENCCDEQRKFDKRII